MSVYSSTSIIVDRLLKRYFLTIHLKLELAQNKAIHGTNIMLKITSSNKSASPQWSVLVVCVSMHTCVEDKFTPVHLFAMSDEMNASLQRERNASYLRKGLFYHK